MATKYGSWGWHSGSNGWRSVLVYTTSETSTTYTINTTLKLQQVGEGYADVKVTAKTSIGNSTSTKALPLASYAADTVTTLMTKSRTYTKGSATQSVTVSGQVDNSWSEQSTVSQTFTVPKLSYKVTYHANGGDGSSVPAAQTKVYGETLRLSSTAPNRAGFTFLGWDTKEDGTGTHYGSGDNYTVNAALDLYAVWLGASVPTIEVLRTNSSGIEDDEGAYGKLTASWQAQGTLAATVAVTARNYTASSNINLSGDTSGTLAAGGTANGSVSSIFGGSLSTDTRYQVAVTLTLTYTIDGSARTMTRTGTGYVDLARLTMDFHVGGDGVAFGMPSTEAGFKVNMSPIWLKDPPTHDTDGKTVGTTTICTAGSGITINNSIFYRWGKVAMLDLAWSYANAVTVSASGEFTDITIGTLVSGKRPATGCCGFSNTAGGMRFIISTAGVVKLTSMDGTGASRTYAAGTLSGHCYATYILP